MYEICQLSEPLIKLSTVNDVLSALPNQTGHISVKYRSQIGMKCCLFLTIKDKLVSETYTGTILSTEQIHHILTK